MVYVTGDCHGDFGRFDKEWFPEQSEMSRDDTVIICGDFGGIWNGGDEEEANLEFLSKLPFTIAFCDGNHENFTRLNKSFAEVDFHGGRAHQIAENVFHLMRGYIFEFDGKSFWVMGGASSHDIDDGILDPEDFPDVETFIYTTRKWSRQGKMFRIKNMSWWEEELPSRDELEFGRQTLEDNDNVVDFIITHCAPQDVCSFMGFTTPDRLTNYFNDIARTVKFGRWYFGHYHTTETIMGKFICLYDFIERIV